MVPIQLSSLCPGLDSIIISHAMVPSNQNKSLNYVFALEARVAVSAAFVEHVRVFLNEIATQTWGRESH